MNTWTNAWIESIASARGSARKAWTPTLRCSSPKGAFLLDEALGESRARGPGPLRLVEEAAALEQACSLLGGDLDVARRQQEHLVRHALHGAVHRVRQPAREVDQPL